MNNRRVGCACEIEIDTQGCGPSFASTKLLKARKDHRCFECKGAIKKGTQYEKVAGKWGTGFETFKTCGDCGSLRTEFFRSGHYFGRIWEDFEIYVDEVAAEISEKCMSNLTPSAREKACNIIQEYWEKHYKDEKP